LRIGLTPNHCTSTASLPVQCLTRCLKAVFESRVVTALNTAGLVEQNKQLIHQAGNTLDVIGLGKNRECHLLS